MVMISRSSCTSQCKPTPCCSLRWSQGTFNRDEPDNDESGRAAAIVSWNEPEPTFQTPAPEANHRLSLENTIRLMVRVLGLNLVGGKAAGMYTFLWRNDPVSVDRTEQEQDYRPRCDEGAVSSVVRWASKHRCRNVGPQVERAGKD
ncbi:hypothetical protein BD309DRAFT_189143 [Dichomitus squalens]|nr:hypothetical protein BD309DRAFT_189143 [Dichomitus squalens]